jgi:hypothetical protein
VAGVVDDREKQIAQLGRALRIALGPFDLVQFLVYLGARAFNVRPVETDARGSFLQLFGALESGKGARHSGQGALVLANAAFLRLQFLPAGAVTIAEDMRVPTDHLVADRRHDVTQGEGAGFLGYSRVVDDLELEVAKLVLERLHVAALDRVGNLIGFLDRIWRDRREILLAIPRAAMVGIAQPPHDIGEILDRVAGRGGGGARAHEVSLSAIIYIM